jgi:hypothetical protein
VFSSIPHGWFQAKEKRGGFEPLADPDPNTFEKMFPINRVALLKKTPITRVMIMKGKVPFPGRNNLPLYSW